MTSFTCELQELQRGKCTNMHVRMSLLPKQEKEENNVSIKNK